MSGRFSGRWQLLHESGNLCLNRRRVIGREDVSGQHMMRRVLTVRPGDQLLARAAEAGLVAFGLERAGWSKRGTLQFVDLQLRT